MTTPSCFPKPRTDPLTPEQQQLAADNLGLARCLAKRFAERMAGERRSCRSYWSTVNQYYRELVDAGYVGLCHAARRFDSSLGWKFSTYAWHWIRREITLATMKSETLMGPKRDRDKCRRVSLFSEKSGGGDRESQGHPLDVWDSRTPPPEDQIDPVEDDLSAEVSLLLELALDRRRARLVRLHTLEGRTLRDLGQQEGISPERVRQLIDTALETLRKEPGVLQALERRTERQRQLGRADFLHTGIASLPT